MPILLLLHLEPMCCTVPHKQGTDQAVRLLPDKPFSLTSGSSIFSTEPDPGNDATKADIAIIAGELS